VASTDVGDLSWQYPRRLQCATFVPGVSAHTWQAAACAGMSVGQKGYGGGETLALSARTFPDPKITDAAKARLHAPVERPEVMFR